MALPLSVSQAVALVKNSLEQISATIVGEVSEFSDKPGYKAVYFTIGDASASLSCLIWRNIYDAAGIQLRQGMLLEVSGIFSVYPAKGRMNFDVKALRPAGEGDLRLKVAQLARKLESEGLMETGRKRALPKLPGSIAVITSLYGKAVHDVLRTLRRRYPLTEVLLVGVQVEGIGAVQSISEGFAVAQKSSAEIILLVRGGGSYEDLMPFNDEILARMISSSQIPVVTGIGHEPDTTIADMVADYRASTPTAAAEHIVPDMEELQTRLNHARTTIKQLLKVGLDKKRSQYMFYRNRPIFCEPLQLIRSHALAFDGSALRLNKVLPNKLEYLSHRITTSHARLQILGSNFLRNYETQKVSFASNLHALSPVAVLSRGYSITFDENKHVVDSIKKAEPGQHLRIQLIDGLIGCQVTEVQCKDIKTSIMEEQ